MPGSPERDPSAPASYIAGMLLRTLDQAVSDLGLEGRHVLVAVSGGVDSTVLLEGLARLSAKRRLTLSVGHVHHGLRGEEADDDEAAVLAQATHLGLEGASERVDPHAQREGLSNRARPTLQEAARNARYAALRAMACKYGADHIATGHNLDDQAETVLMRLLRGTAPDGLGGIPERSPDGVIVRPLLGIARAEIESYAQEERILWQEDRTNDADAYTRNRLRHHWLPGLAREFNPQLLRSIARLAESQRRDSEWIADWVESAAGRFWQRGEAQGAKGPEASVFLQMTHEGWGDLPEALALRLARRAMEEMGAGRDV
ncbi:MAG: tRNA lysidine(34) synthetase TilS, partial [Myxococcota bacterium]|nr:tRNA lysidine(34) synthetase TilS [Myxococcota bacterium]